MNPPFKSVYPRILSSLVTKAFWIGMLYMPETTLSLSWENLVVKFTVLMLLAIFNVLCMVWLAFSYLNRLVVIGA